MNDTQINTKEPTLNSSHEGLQLELDGDALRLQHFEGSIGKLVEAKAIEPDLLPYMDDDRPSSRAVDRFISSERLPVNRFYWDNLTGLDQVLPIDVVPRRSAGKKKSRNGVFFADLALDDGRSVSVAVKPHQEESLKTCLTEYMNLKSVRSLGYHTLQPVGFMISSDVAYSMTLLDEGLSTLDSIDWSVFFPHTGRHPGMRNIIDQTARRIAWMHAEGRVSHNDLAARNVATTVGHDTQGFNVMLIDWEHADIRSLPSIDAESMYARTYPDLKAFMKSFCYPPNLGNEGGIGVYHDKGGDWWASFRSLFLDRYIGFRLDCAKSGEIHAGTSRKTCLRETESELRQLELDLESQMQAYRSHIASIEK